MINAAALRITKSDLEHGAPLEKLMPAWEHGVAALELCLRKDEKKSFGVVELDGDFWDRFGADVVPDAIQEGGAGTLIG